MLSRCWGSAEVIVQVQRCRGPGARFKCAEIQRYRGGSEVQRCRGAAEERMCIGTGAGLQGCWDAGVQMCRSGVELKRRFRGAEVQRWCRGAEVLGCKYGRMRMRCEVLNRC